MNFLTRSSLGPSGLGRSELDAKTITKTKKQQQSATIRKEENICGMRDFCEMGDFYEMGDFCLNDTNGTRLFV